MRWGRVSVLLPLLGCPRGRAEWSEIPDILPTQEGALQIVDIGLPETGHVIAVGHFSSFRRQDCVVLDETRTQLYIYVMDPSEGRYSKSLAIATVPAAHEVVNVVVSDFGHEGYAGLLVMHRPKSRAGDSPGLAAETMHLSLFLGDGKELRPSGWTIDSAKGQPMPLDWDGTMQLALLGVAAAPADDLNLSLWRAKAASPHELNPGWESPAKIAGFPRLALPHWSVQADFNGDGLADLLLMTTNADTKSTDAAGFEIWIRSPSGGGSSKEMPFTLALRRQLPAGAGPLTVADIDGDGHPDIIFAVCYPPDSCARENSLHVMYNEQRRFCSSHRRYAGCRDPDELFSDAGEAFDFSDQPNSGSHMVYTLKSLFPDSDVRVLFADPLSGVPVAISVGDYDLDSYPDLALTIVDRAHPEDVEYARAALLRNVPCTSSTCSAEQFSSERRRFAENREQAEELRKLTGVVGVGFVDWFDMGPPGFIANRYTGTGSRAMMRHVTIRNGISRDAFSLRAEALNGVCPHPCHHANAQSKASQPDGVNFIGPAFRFSFVDPDGATQVRSGTQLFQTVNRALQSSTQLFGLGSTSNFIQRIDVALYTRQGASRHEQTNIIPNSKVIFSPPHADSSSWQAVLQINPGDYIVYVFVSVASALLVLAVITGIFKWQERREDEAERRRATHLINFDAL